MNHSVPDELISAYFDGEVTADERTQVEQLLESSPELRQQLDDTSKLSALLHSFPRETAPSELAAHVQQHVASAVQAPSSPSTDRRSLRREWTAFGVGILATMASLVLFVRLNGRFDTVPSRAATDANIFPAPAPMRGGNQLNKSLAVQSDSAPLAPDEQEDSMNTPSPASLTAKPNHLNWKEVTPSSRSEGLGRSLNSPEMDVAINSTRQSDGEMSSAQAQIRGEFLAQLKTGDVIVSKVADLSNTVVVVDFTVVDIVRDADDLKLVLQKRFVQELENSDEQSASRRNLAQDERESKKKLPGTDDLQVFFVRAPGEELAGAIDEFSRNHPDLNWTPQLPIELPQLQEHNKAEEFRAASNSLADKSDLKLGDSEIDTRTVTAEAELAYGALLARNKVDPSTPVAHLNSSVPQTENKGSLEKLQEPMRQSGSESNPNAPNLNFQKQDSNIEARKRNFGRRGYFQVSAQNPVSGPPVVNSPQNNPLLANSAQPFSNNWIPGNGGGQYRYWNSLSNNENRNSRLVKMLIVLKSEQSAASRTP